MLAWIPEAHSSWALPISVKRIGSAETAVAVGIEQVKALCTCRASEKRQGLALVVADGKYGNHRFLGPLKHLACGKVARIRKDRVLYREPGDYQGKGRPCKHGERFIFKEPETWGAADAMEELEDAHWGKVRLRRWDHLHAHQDAATAFSVVLVETHIEREHPGTPLWLAYQPPPTQPANALELKVLWRALE